MSTIHLIYLVEYINLTFDIIKRLVYYNGRGDIMTTKQIVEMGLAYAGINQAELARRLEWSPQLLNKRLNVGKFTPEEWNMVAKALGSEMKIAFVFPDGKEVG